MSKCNVCGYDDKGTGDGAHVCSTQTTEANKRMAELEWYENLENKIQPLRAKVASAEVLVEALESLVDNFKTMENGFNKTLFDKARKALATYDKLSEVKHDTK